MADTPLTPAIRHIHKLLRSAEAANESDAHLLERYIRRRDEDAFTALVRRHGPLVWRVCRRLLRQPQDAEEVYQATFLVLARRAAKVRKPKALASYLYGVAYRIARNVLADLHRRQSRRDEPSAEPAVDPAGEAAWSELQRILVEEVHALPEKHRTPILLCYWEGLTNEEASRRLGWPVGTVKTRLLKARQLLHERLTRRGVSLSTGAIVTLLATGYSDAAMPPGLAVGVMHTAFGGPPNVAATAAALADQALRGMIGVKMRIAAALLLLAGGTLAVAYYGLRERQTEGKRTTQPNPPPKEAASSRPAKEKQQSRTDHFGDPLPDGAVARLGTRRLCGPIDPMWLRFSPDGTKIAVLGYALTVWDAASGKRLVQRINHDPPVHRMNYDALVNGMAWRKDGTGVAVIRLPDHSYFVSEFTNADEKLPNPPPPPPPHVATDPASLPNGVDTVALSPDGTRLALVRNPNKEKITIDLLIAKTGRLVSELKCERTLGPFDGPCREVRYAAAGQLMILSSPPRKVGDCSLTIVDTENNRVLRTARTPLPVYCSWKFMHSLSADCRLAAIPPHRGGPDSVNDHDGTLRVWDLDKGKQLWSLPFSQWYCGCGHAFSPDGKRLITSTDKDSFRIWDLATGKEAARSPEQTSLLSAHMSAGSITFAFSPDGKRFATSRPDGNIDIWDAQTVKPTLTFAAHRQSIRSVSVSPDGRLAATLGHDDVVRTWELATGRPLCVIAVPALAKLAELVWFIPRILFTPDGRSLLLRAADGLALADPYTGKRLELPAVLRNRQEYIGGFSADGRTLATFREDKVTLWDWPAASIRVTFTVPLNPKRPDWIQKRHPEILEVNSVALSADGRLVFTNSTLRHKGSQRGIYQNSNDVWDGRAGKLLHRLTAPETELPPAVFAPYGCVLYVGERNLHHHGDPERPETARRAANALSAWDLSSGALLPRFVQLQEVAKYFRNEGVNRMVNSLAVSRDGRLLAAAEWPSGTRGRLWLYETASGRVIKELVGHERQVEDLNFTPDGRRLVSVSEDQTGLVWDVTLPALGAAVKPLAHAWDHLAEFDPKSGYNAMSVLAANPTEGISLLREKLRPARVPTEADLDRLMEQLDSDAFAERQKASAELERFGSNVVAGVKDRLTKSPTLEVRKRLLLFLEKYDGPNPHQLRCIRAVATLEAMNTSEARALLAKLANGPPCDILTREAHAASRRAGR